MPYAPTERSRGGEYIGAGIASFGHSMGQGIQRRREEEEKKRLEAKSDSELAKASEAIAANVPGFHETLGVSPEEFRNWSARDKWGAVTGLGKAQVLEQGAAQLRGMMDAQKARSAFAAAAQEAAALPEGEGPVQPMGTRLLGALRNHPDAAASDDFWRAAKLMPDENDAIRSTTDRMNAEAGLMNAERLAGGPREKSELEQDVMRSVAERNRAAAAASGRPRPVSGANNAIVQGKQLRVVALESEIADLANRITTEGGGSGGGWIGGGGAAGIPAKDVHDNFLFADTLNEKLARKKAEHARISREIEVLGGGSGPASADAGGSMEPQAGAPAGPATAAPAIGKPTKRYDPKTRQWIKIS